MTIKISFDEPSEGNVDLNNSTALTIKSTGNKSTAVYAECSTANSFEWISSISGKLNITNISVWTKGIGVYGEGPIGVKGKATKGGVEFAGVSGEGMHGVRGYSLEDDKGVGVVGECHAKNGIGILGVAANEQAPGIGIFGTSKGIGVKGIGRPAGQFEGDVEVTGDIKLLNPMNADCAEDFDILEDSVEPGTVMILGQNGSLGQCYQEYDKKVVGVVSGAGGYMPAMVLGREQESQVNHDYKKKKRLPIALMGKVYCKVDARDSPIETGDILTTSSTKGYAMKAADHAKAFGAVIGKALGSLKEGLGMIPVLVTLQ